MGTQETLLPNPDVKLAELDDGTTVLVNERQAVYYTLNDTGLLVWKAMSKPDGARNGALAASVAHLTKTDPNSASQSVADVLTDMRAEGLLIAAQDSD